MGATFGSPSVQVFLGVGSRVVLRLELHLLDEARTEYLLSCVEHKAVEILP